LNKWKEKFDTIECMGVLHHMKEPEEGLKVLVDLLEDTGQLHLGLYSEYGRQHIVKARDLIAEKGYQSDLEGIRACRSYIKENPEFADLAGSRDFFSTSACRDLIFHVQEKRYTLPEIADMLERNNLKFLRFRLIGIQRHAYLQRFPDDPEAINLEN